MSKNKNTIKGTDENGNVFLFRDLKAASEMVCKNSNLEDWKVQLYIANALDKKMKAFKYKWETIVK